jgi:hypothetical protein
LLILKSNKEDVYVFIENVHSMPTDGVRSAFVFGRGLGWLDMALASCGVDPIRVLPHIWMDALDLKRAGEESRYNYKKRLDELEKMIIPFLRKLHTTGDKEYIYWPNRKPAIEAQIEKILKLTRG